MGAPNRKRWERAGALSVNVARARHVVPGAIETGGGEEKLAQGPPAGILRASGEDVQRRGEHVQVEMHRAGPKDTLWSGAFIPLTMDFPKEYPAKPMKCKFPQGFYHPNIYPSGTVCLSILNEDEGWKPSVSVKQVLMGIQELLDNPNEKSPAQSEAYATYTSDRASYERRVKLEVKKYPPPS